MLHCRVAQASSATSTVASLASFQGATLRGTFNSLAKTGHSRGREVGHFVLARDRCSECPSMLGREFLPHLANCRCHIDEVAMNAPSSFDLNPRSRPASTPTAAPTTTPTADRLDEGVRRTARRVLVIRLEPLNGLLPKLVMFCAVGDSPDNCKFWKVLAQSRAELFLAPH